MEFNLSLLSKLDRWAKARAIRGAMRRPAPGSYPLTGPTVAARDFFDVTLVDPAGDALFSANTMKNQKDLVGYWFTANGRGGHERQEGEIPIADTGTMLLQLRYLYGGEDYTFRNAWTYLLGGETRVKARWAITRFFRGVTHLQSLARQDRMRVLQVVLDRKIEADHTTSPVDVLVALHAHKWLHHPQKDAQMRHINMVLESLAQTEDLKQTDGRYAPTANSLATLHKHETEERRFASQNLQSKVISVLTLILVIIGFAQAYAALFPPISFY